MELQKGPNIVSLPEFELFPEDLELPVMLKVGDDVSTDEIMPAGTRTMPLWSCFTRMSEHAFEGLDPGYPARAKAVLEEGGYAVAGATTARVRAASTPPSPPATSSCAS